MAGDSAWNSEVMMVDEWCVLEDGALVHLWKRGAWELVVHTSLDRGCFTGNMDKELKESGL